MRALCDDCAQREPLVDFERVEPHCTLCNTAGDVEWHEAPVMWLRTTANKRTAPRTRRPRTPRTSEGVVLTQSSPEGAVARVSTGRVGTRRTGPDRLQAVDLLAAQERG